ncbi:hypothetical protein EQV96_20265 [Pseudomonas sp. TMW22080]|nr:hypothetical protein [Pseudomonas sp. TMW22080]
MTRGSWLACDADDADCQAHRSDAIASKPAPTQISEGCHDCNQRPLHRCLQVHRRHLPGLRANQA